MKNLKEAFLNVGLFLLRIMAGTGIAHHGYGKVFGGDITMLIQGVTKMGFPMPDVFAWAAALSEFLGGIMIVFGLYTRVGAFFVFTTMTVAASITHASDALQVKELALAYWTMSGALVLTGPGKLSVDARIFR